MGLYLYAMLPEGKLATLTIEGMDKQPVQLYSIAPFTIAYSETERERFLASRAHLLTHERVIEAVMQAVDVHEAVPLPLQFGMVVEDWQQVRTDLITGHEKDLLGLIANLTGRREVGIKIFWDPTLELNMALEENLELKAKRDSLAEKILSMDDAIAIGQELEAALEQRQADIMDAFKDKLQPLSHEYVENELMTDNMLYNAAFLIDWDKEPEFADLVETLDQQFGDRLRIRYNDFTAPFNFVKLD
ncbi:Gas vesicle synthesis GvpLGvpF [Thalassoporum mexicanum PCC 7367]|uniref:GvpL/GvpF family gas vesicle protein n=1 Tax=Thalassoporum mexicanum TaxID=3457544 RepID=UPI00029FA4F3|nr:GvpL/GvpF family gas vesicle protein [Pseudanabaena sp. PCC 7367]AFY70249.1 Gas vesicle synthesis GvpLGvpF [Pseudanabaena sp. PCC 7367]